MKNFFVILGGMGTLATESFIHLLNKRTTAQTDQNYLNYLVANHADIPDRTNFILDNREPDPRPFILEDIQTLSTLKPHFFVLTCNTAHYFYDVFQKSTTIPILHMPKIAVDSLALRYNAKKKQVIVLLATQGSLLSKVYQTLIEEANYIFLAPPVAIQKKIDQLIYEEIKSKNNLDVTLFKTILSEVITFDSSALILLGCTELSYIYDSYREVLSYPIVDAQSEAVDYILSLQTKSNEWKKQKI